MAQRNAKKDRVCNELAGGCGTVIKCTAAEMRRHWVVCAKIKPEPESVTSRHPKRVKKEMK